MASSAKLGLYSGIGIVVANMIGAGVFLSTGFMAQDLGPFAILLAWVVGTVLALAGARAYAELAILVPRSGGEYRILHDLLHPLAGYMAGWASVLIGFAGPIALDAGAADEFLRTLLPGLPSKVFASGLIVLLTLAHTIDLRVSKRVQNVLVAFKGALILGFVAIGLALGRHWLPTWTPPGATDGWPIAAFMASLFYISFAFSGWNAAIYSAEDFAEPKRDVPRAMLIGCALVAVFYIAVNWVFVANLTPERAAVVDSYEQARITLGHLIASDLLGEVGGRLMSVLIIVAFSSAVSAMMFVGPRVYASMAADGFLPRALASREGRPPAGSVLLQGSLALALLYTHSLSELLTNISAVLVLFSALTAATLFIVRFGRNNYPQPATVSLVAAAVYILSSFWMFYFGFQQSPKLFIWPAVICGVATVAYFAGRWRTITSRGDSDEE